MEAGERTATRFPDTAAAPTLTKPSTAARAYLHDSGCIAVTVSDTGRVGVTVDSHRPMSGHHVAIFWTSNAACALAIKERCQVEETSDVLAVAHGLRIPIASNADTVSNAEAAVRRMTTLLDQARRQGLLASLNARYRIERMKARKAGRGYPTYGVCFRRFRTALLKIAAGQVPDRSLVEIALGGEHKP